VEVEAEVVVKEGVVEGEVEVDELPDELVVLEVGVLLVVAV